MRRDERGIQRFRGSRPSSRCLSSRGMRTGKNEQTAAALPFRTEIWVDERVRTGDCYRNAGNHQNECHGAQRSRPSPDEIHEDSSRIGCAAFTSPTDLGDTRVSSDCYSGRNSLRCRRCRFGRSLRQAVAASRSVNSGGGCRDGWRSHSHGDRWRH